MYPKVVHVHVHVNKIRSQIMWSIMYSTRLCYTCTGAIVVSVHVHVGQESH